MRLINADNFVKNLKLYLDRNFLGEISLQSTISIGEIASLIKDEPTAYDIDKVVAELEADEKHTFDGCINKRYAIKIIKQDNVIE